MTDKPIIAVIAYRGMVGSTTYNYFEKKGYKVMGWSRSNQTHSQEEINKEADVVFVCVPTPHDWKTNKFSTEALEKTLEWLKPAKSDCLVILKSTVTPGTTELMQEKYPHLNLLFNPEFLSEATCEIDFINPDRQIIGYTQQTYKYAFDALHLLPNSPHDVIMSATEAEIVKYVNNFHGSLMVIFSNFIYDVCKAADARYDVVKKSSQASKWVGSPMGRMYWNVNHGGFRGYGGKCFPKDMNNLIEWAKAMNVPAEILEATITANQRILEDQGMNEEEAEKRSSRV